MAKPDVQPRPAPSEAQPDAAQRAATVDRLRRKLTKLGDEGPLEGFFRAWEDMWKPDLSPFDAVPGGIGDIFETVREKRRTRTENKLIQMGEPLVAPEAPQPSKPIVVYKSETRPGRTQKLYSEGGSMPGGRG